MSDTYFRDGVEYARLRKHGGCYHWRGWAVWYCESLGEWMARDWTHDRDERRTSLASLRAALVEADQR